jgi:arylsulfatase
VSMANTPNIVFIHTDQQRGDCLSCEGHPVLETPTMDNIACNGVRLSRFYAGCPICVAARRSILIGQSPQKHGIISNANREIPDSVATLPGTLRQHGYQTYHVGRDFHQHPRRKLYGFDDNELVTGPQQAHFSEYQEWFARNCPPGSENQGHWQAGIMHNDWTARPWHLDEHLHPTNWTVDRAMRFLKRRDPTRSFFLSVGFVAPHPPLQPPQFYFDRYLRTGVPDPAVGDWATADWGHQRDHVAPDKVVLNAEQALTVRAAYYAAINHVDTVLRRLVMGIGGRNLSDTMFVFVSDHGEMLGDHYCWRKSRPFEGAARVPFLIAAPAHFGLERGLEVEAPASHHDIMPTLLDMLDIPIPETVDGRSLYPLLRGERAPWRDAVHIENGGYQHALTDGRQKFIWDPVTGEELVFDLVNDPQELHNLSQNADRKDLVEAWRKRLIDALRERPEGFVKAGRLQTVPKYAGVIPWPTNRETEPARG